MKRIMTIIFLSLVLLLPAGLTNGQDKRNEHKIKVVVGDQNGTEVVIDTTFINTGIPDSLITSDGKVIYISGGDETFKNDSDKRISIISSTGNDHSKSAKNFVFISGDKIISGNDGESFNITISDDESDVASDNITDLSRYVIAKNGITVTIEGKDDTRTRELADKIRKELDIKGNEKN